MSTTINPSAIPGLETKTSAEILRVAKTIQDFFEDDILYIDLAVNILIFEIFGKSHSDLSAKSRKTEYLIPRQVGMYLLLLLGYTTTAVGRHYLRDHATAINARKRCENLLETKYPVEYYTKMVTAIKVMKTLFPNSLRGISKGWDNDKRFKPAGS